MADFNREQVEFFLGTVRKYMQLRGNLSQKDLSELTGVGVSTISRFLNQKTHVLDEQVIARIVAKLNIPLFEILEFIHEEYQAKFQRLVKFYKEAETTDKIGEDAEDTTASFSRSDRTGTAKLATEARVSIGDGPKRTIPFGVEGTGSRKTDLTIGEKLQTLSPKQKVYLQSFLDLDTEGRDLVVDIGSSLFTYFKQKGLEF
ncbi:MAG: helix-turn-helix domain-containing protein [Bacteriovoracaceae bacterium]